jgi:hypothetical protein
VGSTPTPAVSVHSFDVSLDNGDKAILTADFDGRRNARADLQHLVPASLAAAAFVLFGLLTLVIQLRVIFVIC